MEEGHKKFKTANLNSLFLSSAQKESSKPQGSTPQGAEKPSARSTNLSTATGHYKLSATSSKEEKGPGDRSWHVNPDSSTPQPEVHDASANIEAQGASGEKKRSLDMSEEELTRKGIALAPRSVEHQGASWEDEEEEWQPLNAPSKTAQPRPAPEPEVPAWGRKPDVKKVETPKPLHETIRELQNSKKNGSATVQPRAGLAGTGLHKPTVPPGGDALSRFRLNRPAMPPPMPPPSATVSHSRFDRYERVDPLDTAPTWRRPRNIPPPGPPEEVESPSATTQEPAAAAAAAPAPGKTPEELKAEQAEVMRQARERAKARKEAELQEELKRQREREEMLQRQVEEVRLQRAKEREEVSAKQRAEQERRERVREQIRREVHSAPPAEVKHEAEEEETSKSSIPTHPRAEASNAESPAEEHSTKSSDIRKHSKRGQETNFFLPIPRSPITRASAPSTTSSRRKPKVNLPKGDFSPWTSAENLPSVKFAHDFATTAVVSVAGSEQKYYREPLPARLPVRCVHFPNRPKRLLHRRRN